MGKLTEKEWQEILEKWHHSPTVKIQIKLDGHLYIDDHVACWNIVQRLGNTEALALEIRLLRAIETAERRMAERLTR